ncbi:MAG TPA: hypothetical protein VMS12_00255, partial [Thermoanaerobaculia bacterium]|nr:hypothetical protein [Thermoanaerobaculia bacterium]
MANQEDIVVAPKPDPTRVTVDEINERMKRGEPIAFIDTRSPAAWEDSPVKIEGAIRIPADDVDKHVEDIPRDRSIV